MMRSIPFTFAIVLACVLLRTFPELPKTKIHLVLEEFATLSLAFALLSVTAMDQECKKLPEQD
eukprot:1151862-Pelagomonas_calceolata.AAC.1